MKLLTFESQLRNCHLTRDGAEGVNTVDEGDVGSVGDGKGYYNRC